MCSLKRAFQGASGGEEVTEAIVRVCWRVRVRCERRGRAMVADVDESELGLGECCSEDWFSSFSWIGELFVLCIQNRAIEM